MYRILVVDDEYLSREVMKLTIKDCMNVDYEILEAKDGKKAKYIIENYDLDLVILDLSIPGISGIDLCRYIKTKLPNLKIIATTIHDDLEIKNNILKLNISKYLIKPIRPSKITTVIKSILNKKEENKYDTYDISNNYIKDIINYIEKNISKNITLDDAASFVNLSSHYLSKIFKKEIGVNFITYLTNRRIDIAKEMLENENIPISNIAIELSYSKSNYFSKVFKKKVGITPTEYREDYLNQRKSMCIDLSNSQYSII